jgi:hypothetical protein
MEDDQNRQCSPGEIDVRKDFPILMFLWEWKVASTPAIAVRFFSGCNRMGHTAYKRLCRMKKLGFIKTKFDDLLQGRMFSGFPARHAVLLSCLEHERHPICVR